MKGLARLAAVLLASTWAAGGASAQADFPNRPIRLIVPFGPGGATDTVARKITPGLSDELHTSIVVENRPGAAGNLALEAAAKANPDGYTLLIGNVSTNAINPWIYGATLKSNPLKELAAVSLVATVPSVLTGSARFPPNNVAELVAYGKKHPGEINHASAGAGSYAMIDMLAFERAAGLQMVHVPFKGGAGQYVVSLVANDVQISFTNASTVLELIKSGKLKALAITGDNPLPEFPGVQTMAAAGYKFVGTSGWQGVFAPSGTPPAIINRLHAALNKVLARPDVRESFTKSLIVPKGSASPAEFAEYVKADAARWEKLVNDFKITVE